MRSLFRDLAIILLSGLVGTIDVVFKILKWLSAGVGAVVWGFIAAIVGFGMLAEIILTLLMHWSYGRGHMTSAQWHQWLFQFVAVEIFGLLFFGASLGGVPDAIRTAREILRRRRLDRSRL